MTGPQAAMLGHRLHLQHGPIDLIIEATGNPCDVTPAYAQAQRAFDGLLEALAAQLPLLRRDVREIETQDARCPVAKAMISAARRHIGFVTPMAAVAGAVADHILRAAIDGRRLDRAMVNNGGDIAIHLAAGATCTIGLAADQTIVPVTLQKSGGVATSGWRGRSYSLGIADSVTVFAQTAAQADVAATLIANAVDLPDSPLVKRVPACTLSPDSDLGERCVTTAVATLPAAARALALEKGYRRAIGMLEHGLIHAARIGLQGETVDIGPLPASPPSPHDMPMAQHFERHPA